MERSQHYSLRWNNHQSHVLSAFDTLLQNESLVDCTIMCEDSAVRAHKVVLSACSPYFQKIFMDNPGKHPIIVLKDVRCWEMQCILDFMYKGETSVPEPQLTSLIKAAESLKVRGLTSSDQLPPGVSLSSEPSPTNLSNGYRDRGFSPSPSPMSRYAEPAHKLAHLSGGPHSNESSPMSLTHQDQMSDRSRASPVPGAGGATCPRRKQARPRRRSGDSVNSSLDLSKAGSPPLTYKRESPHSVGDEAGMPENLSIRRSGSPGAHTPAINLVKMEQLVEDRDHRMQDNISDGSLDRDCDSKPHLPDGMDRPVLSNGIHHLQEQEALQALNFMASGGGLPHPLLPPPIHSPIHPAMSPHLPPGHGPYSPMLHKSPNGPPTSSPSSYTGRGSKGQHSAPRGGPPRSWTNDDLTKALENVWNKRMTTSQASRVFGIPYNSLLMYVRGKYGKSLRLDVLKKTTPAANDNLNTIGNSRSTPKEKANGNTQREGTPKLGRPRKPSHDTIGAGGIFPFDQPGMNPFGNGLLNFSSGLPEHNTLGLLGLAGLPPGHNFLVLAEDHVAGSFDDIEKAKAKLMRVRTTSRMIAEVDSSGALKRDPHQVGGYNQTPEAGFNKFWYDWWDINRMMDVAQQFIDAKKGEINEDNDITEEMANIAIDEPEDENEDEDDFVSGQGGVRPQDPPRVATLLGFARADMVTVNDLMNSVINHSLETNATIVRPINLPSDNK